MIKEHKYKLWKDIEIEVKPLGLLVPEFETEGKARHSYLVVIKRKNKQIDFRFYDSIHNSDIIKNRYSTSTYKYNSEMKRIKQDLIYSILCSIEMDYNFYCDDIHEFISEYGYEFNKHSEGIFNRCKEQRNKLREMFVHKEIEKLTENEDILKKTITKSLIEV